MKLTETLKRRIDTFFRNLTDEEKEYLIEKYFNKPKKQLNLHVVGFSETEVCGYCDGDKWISEGVRDVPCPSCGCTGVKQT